MIYVLKAYRDLHKPLAVQDYHNKITAKKVLTP
ncbi:hypothetical protein DET49_12051 [Salegentibacter sp. 24]|nr:hypothetical protein DET49_12051 [Salegentibacter sp. 24]